MNRSLGSNEFINRYRIALLAALIALAISLLYNHINDRYHHQPMMRLDIYSSYALNMHAGFGYGGCVVDENLQCTATNKERLTDRAYRLPGYPVLLYILMLSGTENFTPLVLFVQSIMLSGIVFITVEWASQWGKGTAILCSIMMLCTLSWYEMASLIMTEIWFSFLLILLLRILSKSQTSGHYLIVGVLLGFALLTRGVLLFTIPLLFLFWRNKRLLIISYAVAALFIVTWAVRNYQVFHAFVPFSTGSGQVLYGSNNPSIFNYSPGLWLSPITESDDYYIHLDELEQDRALTRSTIQYLASLDIQILTGNILLKNIGFLGFYNEWYWNISLYMYTISIFFVLLRYIFKPDVRFYIKHLISQDSIRIMLIFILGALINTMLFWANYRLRLPYEPYLILIGCIFLTASLKQLSISKNSLKLQ